MNFITAGLSELSKIEKGADKQQANNPKAREPMSSKQTAQKRGWEDDASFVDQSQNVKKQTNEILNHLSHSVEKMRYQGMEWKLLSNTSILPITRPNWPAPPVCFLWR